MPQAHLYTEHELGLVHSKVGKPGKEVSRMSLTLVSVPVTDKKEVDQQRHEYFLTDRQCRDLIADLEAHHQKLIAW